MPAPSDGYSPSRRSVMALAAAAAAVPLTGASSVMTLASVAELHQTAIDPSVTAVELAGYYAPGDGGDHIRIRGTAPGQVASADGASWVVGMSRINHLMFGGKLNDQAAAPLNNTAFDTAFAFLLAGSGATIGGVVEAPTGLTWLASKIAIPPYCGIAGTGTPNSATLRAIPTFRDLYMVGNQRTDGHQEYCNVENLTLDGNARSGAVQTQAVLSLTSIFVNSHFSDLIVSNGSSIGVYVGASAIGAGPLEFTNMWVIRCGTDNIVVEDSPTNHGAMAQVAFRSLASEHWGHGHHALVVRGHGRLQGIEIDTLHMECEGVPGDHAVLLDGCADFVCRNVVMLATNPASFDAIFRIAKNGYNSRWDIEDIFNNNLLPTVIIDEINNITVGHRGNLAFYKALEFGIMYPEGNQTLTFGSSVPCDLTLGNHCMLAVSDGRAFQIGNPINAYPGQRLTFEIVNSVGGGGAMGKVTWGSAYAMSAWTSPPAGKRALIQFICRAPGNWIEMSRRSDG